MESDCKTIEITFNGKELPKDISVQLVNVEIDVKMADQYNDDDTLDRQDEYIPVSLQEIGRKVIETNCVILFLYFENGQTLFNDGAMFLIKFEANCEPITYVYRYEKGKWDLVEGCKEIKIDRKYVKYKLIHTEWKCVENKCSVTADSIST